MATAAVHSPDEAAQRILPAAAPLTVDPVQDVRHTALACVQTFAQILADHSRTLDDTLAAAGRPLTAAAKCLEHGRSMVRPAQGDCSWGDCALLASLQLPAHGHAAARMQTLEGQRHAHRRPCVQAAQGRSCSRAPQRLAGMLAWAATWGGPCRSTCAGPPRPQRPQACRQHRQPWPRHRHPWQARSRHRPVQAAMRSRMDSPAQLEASLWACMWSAGRGHEVHSSAAGGLRPRLLIRQLAMQSAHAPASTVTHAWHRHGCEQPECIPDSCGALQHGHGTSCGGLGPPTGR